MALIEDIALLNRVDLFRELGEDKLRLIAFGAERRRLQPGQVLFRQDAPADCAFVVADGKFELTQAGRDGTGAVIGTAGPGTLLGEIAMISPVTRSMSAIALESSEIMRINRPLFRRMLEEYPEIAEIIRRRLAGSLEQLSRDIGKLADRFQD
ncbi:hypothetical protein DFR52_105230 [Hoeflea marina]|uniref:Cyclic nucleotide-binding domain-containing protein n=1 Tax=Hoeflea marina TaxID=274592 RepID=A0A317PEP3_9HYPH|nr:cyclic nucleotide-binding domain-containing protein [Hoeflea marina]PWV98249.1 hypothetical protein DFR52_105230 [Hoeflea marina]